jgi:uncharacterized protein (TIGR03435 family)
MIVVTWVGIVLGLTSLPAVQSDARPRFEVASVKESAPDLTRLPRPGLASPGRFGMDHASLRFLVTYAYGPLFDFQLMGGPGWQTSRYFDIHATTERAAPPDEMRLMLRTLLEERFQLRVHTETREMPIYALVVARDGRLGANIRPSAIDCNDPAVIAKRRTLDLTQGVPCMIMPVTSRVPGGSTLRANGVSMEVLANFLPGVTGRLIQDRTGLGGLYDWELTYDRGVASPPAQPPDGGVPPVPSLPQGPALTTALQEQLGLKLESTRGPVEVLVIDSAALPEPD